MKKWILTSGCVGLILAGTGAALWWHEVSSVSEAGQEEGAAHVAPSPNRPAITFAQRQKANQDIDALLRENTTRAWNRITTLYPAADEATKRRVLQKIAKFPDLQSALHLVIGTVGNDPLPASEDPMVNEAATVLKSRWKEPEDMHYGRQMMLAQKTDKAKWVVAKALIVFATDIDEGNRFYAQKYRLKAKLVDVHSTIRDGFIRAEVVDGLSDLGGEDAALILAKGPAVTDRELATVRAEGEARDAVLREQESR